MTSNRPDTSSYQTSVENTPGSSEDSPVDKKTLPLLTVNPYVPHIFDLVGLTHRLRDTAKLRIPPTLLQSEAVDSSLLLGHGASFTVTRQALPPAPTELVERTDMGGWIVEQLVKVPPRPRYIVYKSARVSFQPNGEPVAAQDRRALQSVLTEFHALLHPPLLAHPNILDVLGLAWGSNHAQPLHRLPVLVVEYGDRGTLSDVLALRPALSFALKQDICLGIARGLEVLHANGIVHGDVKPDNIIMCSHKEKGLIPKLADFGFAVVEATEASAVVIGGTKTWRAPETYSAIPVSKLKLTDVYSFGLVAWSIAIDGLDPFSLMLSGTTQSEDYHAAIKEFKVQDKVLEASIFEKWIFKWFQSGGLSSISSQLSGPTTEVPGNVFQSLDRVEEMMARLSILCLQLPHMAISQELVSEVSALFRKQPYFQILESLLACTLSRVGDDRDLTVAINLIESTATTRGKLSSEAADMIRPPMTGRETEQNEISATNLPNSNGKRTYKITNVSNETHKFRVSEIKQQELSSAQDAGMPEQRTSGKINWSALGFKFRRFSWQMTRDLDPIVQTFAVNSLHQLDDAPSRFALSAFLLNGYGLPVNSEQGLKYMTQAAGQGHFLSQAYLFRMSKACQVEMPPEIPVFDYLKRQALNGSRTALLDLKVLDPQQAQHIRGLVKFGYGGVGCNWFHEDQWLHGLSQPKLMSKDFAVDSLGSGGELQNVVVTARGDRLVHAAAAVGAYGVVNALLTNTKVDVNQQNAKGETALLCACRSGHANIVKLLLDSGAKASIQSDSGETPLHWLLSFDDNINIAALGKDLVGRGGASIDASTNQRISYSIFPASIDVDFQMEGTPLMWAVHDNKPRMVSFLLTMGADPNSKFQNKGLSPLGWAAYFHYHDCLKLMIEHLEKTVDVSTTTEGKKDSRQAVMYGPLVRNAVHAADKFSMILRNGANYEAQMKSTLGLLKEKTAKIRFTVGDKGQNETLIHLAAREAHDQVCEFILGSGWRTEELNQQVGGGRMTPILQAVRWNRRPLFQLLLNHGADARALASSPYDETVCSWSALHVFAEQAHNGNLSLVDDLLAAGVPVDGNAVHDLETPFNVAVRRNAFSLADYLLHHGALLNAMSTQSSLIVSPHSLTGLGHIIALNGRHSIASLRYLLRKHEESWSTTEGREGILVETDRELSPLHLNAIVPHGLVYAGSGEPLSAEDFDWNTNQTIAAELILWSREFAPRQLDRKCRIQGKTALHLAAEYGNVGVVEELIKAGADQSLLSEEGETAVDMAKRVFAQKDSRILKRLLDWLE